MMSVRRRGCDIPDVVDVSPRGSRFCGCHARIDASPPLARVGTSAEVDERLVEMEFGRYDGRTVEEIRRERPGWTYLRDGCPGGEGPADAGNVGGFSNLYMSELRRTDLTGYHEALAGQLTGVFGETRDDGQGPLFQFSHRPAERFGIALGDLARPRGAPPDMNS